MFSPPELPEYHGGGNFAAQMILKVIMWVFMALEGAFMTNWSKVTGQTSSSNTQ